MATDFMVSARPALRGAVKSGLLVAVVSAGLYAGPAMADMCWHLMAGEFYESIDCAIRVAFHETFGDVLPRDTPTSAGPVLLAKTPDGHPLAIFNYRLGGERPEAVLAAEQSDTNFDNHISELGARLTKLLCASDGLPEFLDSGGALEFKFESVFLGQPVKGFSNGSKLLSLTIDHCDAP
jgi:hypothetical protein